MNIGYQKCHIGSPLKIMLTYEKAETLIRSDDDDDISKKKKQLHGQNVHFRVLGDH